MDVVGSCLLMIWAAGCSGLVVTCLTAMHDIPGSNLTVSSLCFCHKNHRNIRDLGSFRAE